MLEFRAECCWEVEIYLEEEDICSRDVYIIVFRDSVMCGGKVEYGSAFATNGKNKRKNNLVRSL
jgi:hypothetical protein